MRSGAAPGVANGEAGWTGPPGLTINRRSLAAVPGSARVAQLVEQATENRCVGGSIPPPGTILLYKSGTLGRLGFVDINCAGTAALAHAQPTAAGILFNGHRGRDREEAEGNFRRWSARDRGDFGCICSLWTRLPDSGTDNRDHCERSGGSGRRHAISVEVDSLRGSEFQLRRFGVALFFLISGFVVTLSLDRTNTPSFIWARAWRIIPTYAAGFSCILAALMAASHVYRKPFPYSLHEVLVH
jgi:hypothetical protein